MIIWILIGTAIALVALGGLLAALDAALSSLPRAAILEEAETASAGTMLRRVAADIDGHQNAVNFLRIVAETTAAVLVTLAFTMLLPEWWQALLLAAVLMAGVSFVLVGSSPRSIGRAHAPGLLRWFAPLLRFVRIVVGPFAKALTAFGDWVTPGRTRAALSSEEQLLQMVDEAAEQEVLEEDDRELIHSIFEFSDTLVRAIMVPRTDMVVIESDASLSQGMERFFSSGVSRLPVIGESVDEVLGVLYLRDVARFAFRRQEEMGSTPVRELARQAVFVPDSKKADETLRQMQLESNHLAIVVDEYGGVAGLVTLEDLIEELVGEISDEYDREVPEVLVLDSGRYRVSARLSIDELGDLFGLDIEDDEVDTVGGLLAKALGRLPATGDSVAAHQVQLTADRTEGRRKRLITVVAERAVDDGAGAGNDRGQDESSGRGSGRKRGDGDD